MSLSMATSKLKGEGRGKENRKGRRRRALRLVAQPAVGCAKAHAQIRDFIAWVEEMKQVLLEVEGLAADFNSAVAMTKKMLEEMTPMGNFSTSQRRHHNRRAAC